MVNMDKKPSLKYMLLNIDVVIASICMCVLVGCTFAGVIARYVLSKPFGWIEEIQAALIVWVIFGAAGAAFRTANHAAIEVFFDMYPKPVQKVLNVVILAINIITLLYLGYTSLEYIKIFAATGRTTSVLHLSYISIFIIVPISCIWQIFNYVLVTYTDYTEKETIAVITEDDYKNTIVGSEDHKLS
jgi:C4-dicarboxylate transporter DctQ subunit